MSRIFPAASRPERSMRFGLFFPFRSVGALWAGCERCEEAGRYSGLPWIVHRSPVSSSSLFRTAKFANLTALNRMPPLSTFPPYLRLRLEFIFYSFSL